MPLSERQERVIERVSEVLTVAVDEGLMSPAAFTCTMAKVRSELICCEACASNDRHRRSDRG